MNTKFELTNVIKLPKKTASQRKIINSTKYDSALGWIVVSFIVLVFSDLLGLVFSV